MIRPRHIQICCAKGSRGPGVILAWQAALSWPRTTTIREEAFRRAAQENDLVIVATDNMHEILRNNAANFRRKKFGVIDAGIRAPNVSCVTFADEQAACLAGAAAAMLAKARGAGAIGWLSGMDTPAMRSLFFGIFRLRGNDYARYPGCPGYSRLVHRFRSGRGKAAQLAGTASVIALAAGAANPAAAKAIRDSKALVICLDAWQPDLAPGKQDSSRNNQRPLTARFGSYAKISPKTGSGAKEIVIYMTLPTRASAWPALMTRANIPISAAA